MQGSPETGHPTRRRTPPMDSRTHSALVSAPASAVIGYDASVALGPRSGIGEYTAQLLTAMAPQLPEAWQMRVLVNSFRPIELPEHDGWTHAENLSIHRGRIPGRVLLSAWRLIGRPKIESVMGPIDLFHSPASYLAPSRRAATIITVHDLFFLSETGDLDAYGGAYFKKTFPGGLKKCAKIIADSEFTRGGLIDHFGLDPSSIAVVHLGVDHERFAPEPRPDDADRIEAITHGEAYLLCVSTVGPKRKNLPALIEAYARARARHADLPRLVIAGKVDPERADTELRAKIDSCHLGARVSLVGYVSSRDLPALYRGARAALIPSLTEGFGLTALEAMAGGVPLAAARSGSLPEVCGEAALLFDAKGRNDMVDSEAMAHAIGRIAGEERLRQRLRSAGLERARTFTWKATAKSTLDVYAEILDGKRTS